VGKKIIVGLGNPGLGYRNTRHNAGFLALELLAEGLSMGWKGPKRSCVYGSGRVEGQDFFLLKPQTFMNRSGEAVQDWVRREGLDPAQDLMVVCDDMDLGLGRLRLRASGSPGSHNGLASLAENLGGGDFARLRLGIGKPSEPSAWADYVLQKFPPEERDLLEPVLEKAAKACRQWLEGRPFEQVMSFANAPSHAKP
jgi:PTH1 family peptidyl-tRNA hydrolase